MTGKIITFICVFALMFAVWLTFVVYYANTTGGRWRNTPEGRHLMSLAIVFVWNAGLILVNVLAGQYPGRFIVQIVSYSAFILVGVQRIFLLARAQRLHRQRRAAERAAMNSVMRKLDEQPDSH